VIWAFDILTCVNSDFDNPSQPSKSAEIPSQWQYLAVTISACFAHKNELLSMLFRAPTALPTQTDNDLFCAERAQSRWSAAKASNTFTAHSEARESNARFNCGSGCVQQPGAQSYRRFVEALPQERQKCSRTIESG
jgi:hypothetical protein